MTLINNINSEFAKVRQKTPSAVSLINGALTVPFLLSTVRKYRDYEYNSKDVMGHVAATVATSAGLAYIAITKEYIPHVAIGVTIANCGSAVFELGKLMIYDPYVKKSK